MSFMRKSLEQFNIKISISIILTSLILSGCVTTKPNIPFAGNPYLAILSELSKKNPLLAEELGKLPEFQDAISDSENKALGQLVEIYNENQEAFNKAFEQMYQVGKPEVRKYCSPLQALFWLSLEENFETINYHIKNFRLRSLLNDAWDFSRNNLKGKYLDLSRKQAKIAIQGYKEGWVDIGLPLDQLNNRILETYYEDSKQFDKVTRDLISKSIKTQPNVNRWKHFSTVADRLNAPELVDYWIWNNVTYRKAAAHGAYRTFKSKKGQCTDASYFSVYMLKKAGYKTFMRSVKWSHDPWNGVHTGAGVILDDGSYLLVADFNASRMSGPYKDLSILDNKLAGGRIIDRRWGAYYPPR